MSETITYLEMHDVAELREPERGPALDFEFERVYDHDVNRTLYAEIGQPHQWIDRLRWDDDRWREWAGSIETWVVRVDGEMAGYTEIKVDKDSALISIFGLRKAFQARGLGGVFLSHAIRRGFELAPRVWVSTNTMDGEHALANYEARGMVPFKRATLA